MTRTPIVAARPQLDADGPPRSAAFDDVYHPRAGALAQARAVFLAGNGLPSRWHGRERFVILETGFGLGNNFLATWAAHRDDPKRPARLHYVAIEAHPLVAGDLAGLARDPGLAGPAGELVAAWPPLTAGLHRLVFDAGAVELLLALGDVAALLPQIEAGVDAFFLDGFAPAKNPAMWEPRVLRALARIAAPGATLATWTAARAVRDGLRSAGFAVETAPGSGGKRDITLARFAPPFASRPAPRRRLRPAADADIVIVGAGLAGCAAADALAAQGRTSTLIERHGDIATEGSGNAVGIFHGVVHADDGRHARFHRAAALEAARAVRQAIARHGVAGSCSGLLRLAERATGRPELDAVAARLGLPAAYVRALAPDQASELAGTRIDVPAWYYPQGGWVDPRGLARASLAEAGPRLTLRLGCTVAALRRGSGAWLLLDAAGGVVAEAAVVVLANAGAAFALLGGDWPVACVRGQLGALPSEALTPSGLPLLPLAGSGYVVPAHDGRLWFGATTQAGDADRGLRTEDDAKNRARLARLMPDLRIDAATPPAGRTGFRWVSDDRLPLVGAVPAAAVAALAPASGRPERLDQPRFIERAEGLFVFAALGSRGIAASALGAQVLAAAITGAPCPLEADLIDAVDPARFISRAWRRGGTRPGPPAPDQPPLGPMAGGSAGR